MKAETKKKISMWSLRILLLIWSLVILGCLIQMELAKNRTAYSLTGHTDLGDSTNLEVFVTMLIGSSIGMLCLIKLGQWENMNEETEGRK